MGLSQKYARFFIRGAPPYFIIGLFVPKRAKSRGTICSQRRVAR